MSSEQNLPTRPAENPPSQAATTTVEGADGEIGPNGEPKLSKKALKKLEKEREKAAKKQAQQEKDAAAKAAAEANDISKGLYGDKPVIGTAEYTPLHIPLTKLPEVADLADGIEVAIRAQISNSRPQGAKLTFLNLRHAQVSIQAVLAVDDTISRQMAKYAAQIPVESIVDIVGFVKDAPEPVNSATISLKELHVRQLWVISKAISQLPISVEDSERRIPLDGDTQPDASESFRPAVTLPTRIDNRVIDLRATLTRSIVQISDGVQRLFEEYLWERGFTKINTPKLLGAPSEGGSNVFEVKYFDKKAYLAQSPQLYKQMMIASGYEKVFEVAPVFRAENSNTSRHLTEYTSLDLEMEFDNNYEDVMFFIRDLLLYILQGLSTKYQKQTERVRDEYKAEPFLVPDSPDKVPVITFAEGVALLKEAQIHIEELTDINSTEEKILGGLVRGKYKSDFYILKQYPLGARAFYTMPSSEDSNYSNSFDFMMRGQEVLSGAQRIHDTALLKERCKAIGIDPDGPGLKDYVQCFSYGCRPHAGGAFGLERVVLNYLGLPNVRLATLFPRDPGRLMP